MAELVQLNNEEGRSRFAEYVTAGGMSGHCP